MNITIKTRKATVESVTEEILEFLTRWDTDEGRENWKSGASVSYVKTHLRETFYYGKFGSNIYDFMDLLEDLGFTIKEARTKNGFHKSARVVTL